MVNRELPHVLVLPEDRANLQLATGFHQNLDWDLQRRMQVLPVAGGWIKVLTRFKTSAVAGLKKCPDRFMVLLIDLDGKEERLVKAKAAIPEELADQVFILSVKKEPEALKTKHGSYETIGFRMAKACRGETDAIWDDDLLRHNRPELDRLRERVVPILFKDAI